MRKSYLLAIVLLIIVASLFIWLLNKKQTEEPGVSITATEEARFADAQVITYDGGEKGEVSISYVGDLARIKGGEYDGVTLRQVVSASGAKYEDGQGLTVWSKGDEVRIETPQSVVYNGIAIPTEVANESIPTPLPEAESTSTDSVVVSTTTNQASLIDKTWLWQKALIDGEDFIPKKVGSFSLTLSADGKVEGKTDCNGFGGDYKLEGDTIQTGEYMSTLMYCEGSEEGTFTALLSGSLKITSQSETELTLENSKGDKIYFIASTE